MEINTEDNIVKENSMVKVNIFGLMDLSMKEISLKGLDLDKETGDHHVEEQSVIIMLENI